MVVLLGGCAYLSGIIVLFLNYSLEGTQDRNRHLIFPAGSFLEMKEKEQKTMEGKRKEEGSRTSKTIYQASTN